MHWGSSWQPRWQASEHGVESNAADNVRMHVRTFRRCVPFSCFQLLVLVVCAAASADMKFMMTRPRKWCSMSGVRSQKYVCQRRATRHAHACDGGRGRSREMVPRSRLGRTVAYRT